MTTECRRKSLAFGSSAGRSGGTISYTCSPTAARIAQEPTDIVFAHASGHEVPLRQLGGRPVTVAFWRSRSKQSIDHIRSISADDGTSEKPVVLCISDG